MEPQFNTTEAGQIAAGICQHTRDNPVDAKLRELLGNKLSDLGLTCAQTLCRISRK